MAKGSRQGTVTEEHREEARKLRQLWDSRSHPTQAEFGELYKIGNQSAVSQFLRGDAAMSLKAARGFAEGLSCRLEDFSPRLAAEAAAVASMVPSDHLSPEVSEIAHKIDKLAPDARDFILRTVRGFLKSEQERLAAADARQQKRKRA